MGHNVYGSGGSALDVGWVLRGFNVELMWRIASLVRGDQRI